MLSNSARLIWYYGAVIAGGLLVHQAGFTSLVGDELGDLFRRNSEAYVLMLLIPAYWDFLGPPQAPRVYGAELGAPLGNRGLQVLWFGVLGLAGIVLQTNAGDWLNLRQSVITLGEAFVAAFVICMYLGWSRGFFGFSGPPAGGGPVFPSSLRAWYYGALAGIAIIAQQAFVSDLAPDVAERVQVNIEASAAMLIIPLYFDIVARPRPRWVLAVWCAVMVVVPILSQPGVLDSTSLAPLAGWMVRATEAFVAGLVIALYFSLWRPDHAEK